LSGAARSWLINLPEGSIHSWDQLYVILNENFQGTYERPSTIETLKTIKQKHNDNLRDYVKHFCNLKTVEEIAMKKPKTVTDLLTVADVCIEASESPGSTSRVSRQGAIKKKG
jgi:hypothetical protein